MADVTPNPDGKTKDKETPAFTPPSDGSWVPRDRLNDAVDKERRKADEALAEASRLRAEVEALRTQNIKPPVTYTRAELKALVDDQKLTEDQAETLWERQVEERLAKKLETTLTEKSKVSTIKANVSQLLNRYMEEIPDLKDKDSESWKTVNKEFKYLVEVLGEPLNEATEVKAIRQIFGPPDTIKARNAARDGHQEIGGGGGGGGGGAEGSTVPGGHKISGRMKAFFDKQIEMGQYKDWNDPALQADAKIAAEKGR